MGPCHSAPHECGRLETETRAVSVTHGSGAACAAPLKASSAEQKEQLLTRQNVFVAVLVFVLCSLALFAAVEELALLLLQGLDERNRGGESNFSALLRANGGDLHRDSTGRLTSNSSQKPCLTLSVASASLLSSRTRLSISAALMRVVFRGCGRKQQSATTRKFCLPFASGKNIDLTYLEVPV